MRNNKTKIITLALLIIAVIGLSIGFAAFASTLNISTSARVNPTDTFSVKFSNADNIIFLIFFCILTALITAVIPFLTYTLGLKRVEPSKAGIIATIEPLVATVVGIVIFSEPMTIMSGCGIILILSAVILLSIRKKT